MSFDAQTFKILKKLSLSIFNFVACAFGVISNKSLPSPIQRSFSCMFSSEFFFFFSTLGLTVRSLIHFEFIFGYGFR